VDLPVNVDLSDTHCHLDLDAFDSDREEVIERARQGGVSRILDPGVDQFSSQAAIRLAEKHAEIYAAVGIHPNEGPFPADQTEWIEELASNHKKVVAIGEIGLDYYRDRTPREDQRKLFIHQLQLARQLGLPVIIHNRNASQDLLSILKDWQVDLVSSASPLADRPGVLHSFSADSPTAARALEMGFFIGITGPITFRNSAELQKLAAGLPLERLLLETDAPFMAPHPHRGRRNEPAFVRYTAEKIASIRNQPLAEIVEKTSANAKRLFKW
jgi:TatD DNase family protein